MIVERYIDIHDSIVYLISKENDGYKNYYGNVLDFIAGTFDNLEEAEAMLQKHRPNAVLFNEKDEKKVNAIVDVFYNFLKDKGINKVDYNDFFDVHYKILSVLKIKNQPLKEKADDMIEAFEDFLDEKGIEIQNQEKEDAIHDAQDKESICNVYGSDYGNLEEEILAILSDDGAIQMEMTRSFGDYDSDVDESDVYFDDELDDFEYQTSRRM